MDNLSETVQTDTVCKRQEESCRGKVGLVQWDISDNSAVDSEKENERGGAYHEKIQIHSHNEFNSLF